MAFAINLSLLILGTLGTLAAFGGETWRKTNDPLLRRITLRGWVALICIISTLGLGIYKERMNSDALAESIIARKNSEEDLRKSREQLQKVALELSNTRLKLSSLEPRILQAIVTTTTGIRRETDFATPHIQKNSQLVITSGKTNKPLVLYGGDFIDYNVFCRNSSDALYRTTDPSRSSNLILSVGNTQYKLGEHGKEMIIGKVGEEMTATVSNFGPPLNCDLKILVESADRTREAILLNPLLELIQEAKAEADK
ncbi:hypothetical protein [Pseudomonas fluorescens]|uniref:Uncharacterized protein n=1 Tax=Pseudomonas fluorescens TaxID=294 RepID=A0A5E7U314_PSEFL|nr:hypothetical protein [Pseudomonas fluorescens]VVO15688.1 hypothetical protein PS833_03796 [Pseudomonas fluorescens]VVQ05742.1 hypothetical protein PS914_04546 [Pseudomonas fluorescens]